MVFAVVVVRCSFPRMEKTSNFQVHMNTLYFKGKKQIRSNRVNTETQGTLESVRTQGSVLRKNEGCPVR